MMPGGWALQDAKNRFSEVVDRAAADGPQTVTRRGVPVAVILSFQEYCRLTGDSGGFVDFLLSAPAVADLNVTRDSTSARDVDLG
jgi:prevent-host-death family protein